MRNADCGISNAECGSGNFFHHLLREKFPDPHSAFRIRWGTVFAFILHPLAFILVPGCGSRIDFDNPTKADIPGLIEALGDEDVSRRRRAAFSLGKLGPDAKEAVPALIEALGDPDLNVCVNAVHCLGIIGPDAKQAVPSLRKAINDPDEFDDIREEAIDALELIDPDGSIAAELKP